MSKKETLLKVDQLTVAYGNIPIVKDVSFSLCAGEIFGIVGESGCGKSTLLRSLMALKKNGAASSGSVNFSGMDLTALPDETLRHLRGGAIAMIPQNAFLSMDPTKTISSLFYETISVHRKGTKRADSDKEAAGLMKKLLLQDPERILKAYPFELSGGMCQRVMIAVAMINHPKLILGDEPTSALDVTSQAQVVEQIKLLRKHFAVSMILVSHNLGVIAHLADKIAVMYAGRIVECGLTQEILEQPQHPYTKALISAVPTMDGMISEGLKGTPPVFTSQMIGCSFADRCSEAQPVCRSLCPSTMGLSQTHQIACHLFSDNGRIN